MFEGSKVRLRAYRREDLPLALAYVNDPEVRANTTPGILTPLTMEDEIRWFEANSKEPNKSYSFAIERKEDGQYLGGCSYKSVDWLNSVVTVGIFLGPMHLSQGYGTDALKVLLDFIFEQMNIHKVCLGVFGFNARALRCYEKCGFKTEGILRKEIFRNGEYHDSIYMGILRDEWLSLRTTHF